MIYLDNSASTLFKPDCVINAVTNSLKFLSANPGRSGHSAALRGAALVTRTRELLGRLLGCAPERVIFTDNCTGALGLALMGTAQKGGHVVTTAFEHNAVLRTLYAMKRIFGTHISVAMPDESGSIPAAAIERLVRKDTYAVIVNHVSNVTGAIAPIDAIGRMCRRRNLLFIVDGAQSVGYADIDMDSQFIDLLAVAPHKGLHAPQGVGVLAVGERAELRPVRFGGTGTDSHKLAQPAEMPEGFETGTLPTPAIAGLAAAIGWSETNKLKLRDGLQRLSARLRRGLAAIPKVKILSPENALAGIIAFNIEGLPSQTAADLLSSEYDICVRAGLHCAPLAHETLGTLSGGAIRASLGCDLTAGDIDFFLSAVNELASST